MNGNEKESKLFCGIDVRILFVIVAAAFIAGLIIPNLETIDVHGIKKEAAPQGAFYEPSENKRTKVRIKELHAPTGQHLLVDIEGVDEDFLNSKELLSKAMVDTVSECGLQSLSNHCQALKPDGVSCIALLTDSHISLRTWPRNGVIDLDLITWESNLLLPTIDKIERLFGIPSQKNPDKKVRMQWGCELRGFRSEEEVKKNCLEASTDLHRNVFTPLEMYSKKEIYSSRTKFHQVDIWDNVYLTDTPSYDDILLHNMRYKDPRAEKPEFTSPQRYLYLDGTFQSTFPDEKVYHEALVHPAMFAHPHPKRVAIVGGSHGAALREVLKHNTVESATMVDIDAELVDIVRQYLPYLSDCSDLVGRAKSCFDDELVKVYFEDSHQWFIDRYSASPTVTPDSRDFDVVIVDSLHTTDESEKSELLHSDDIFLSSLVNSLSEDGVLAIQVGPAATIDNPRPDIGIYRDREAIINRLEANPSVQVMFVYEEGQSGFEEPRAFLIACRTASCRSRWYARSDQIDYQIYERIVQTHSKNRTLTFFDGTTQRSYQWPKKGWETVYCRREPTPFECAYRTMDGKAELHEFSFDSDEDGEGKSSFRIETTTDQNGRALTRVFATTFIPKGSFIMPSHLASSLVVTTRNLDGLQNILKVRGGQEVIISEFMNFFDEHARSSRAPGSGQHYVEVGASAWIRRTATNKEVNVGPWVPPHPSGRRPTYSPVYERHRLSFEVLMVALRDIVEGEELVMAENAKG